MSIADILIRMLAACAFGFIIGFDREYRQRPAGLRTITMVSLASCTFAVIAIEMAATINNADTVRLDPTRAVEAVTAGVAFVAAGTIIQARGDIRGLTTGASMWLSGSVGLASGAGYLSIALMATVLAMVILVPMHMLERRLPKKQEREPASSD
ncbi:MAG: MgtC/SapB family protein [Flavobacteriaceae bacterium]